MLGSLRRRVIVMSDQITKDIREHSAQRSSTRQAISDATDAIQELFKKIKSIKEKARIRADVTCSDLHSHSACFVVWRRLRKAR